MKLKLHRDKVVSIVKGKSLVGVYIRVNENTTANTINGHYAIELPEAEILLAEISPAKADKFIKLWNSQ